MLSKIKITELWKKQEIHSKKYNTIVDKAIAKEKKAKSEKQETGNKEHIVE